MTVLAAFEGVIVLVEWKDFSRADSRFVFFMIEAPAQVLVDLLKQPKAFASGSNRQGTLHGVVFK